MWELQKANEILDKLCFFGGQRAGRELWNAKPRKVQDEDIANFNRDIEWLRDFIRRMNDDWIPVEERRPEEPKENPEFEGKKIELYLVTVKETKYPFRAFWNGKQFTDGWSVLDVIAWRTLPEPYRPEN